MGTISDLEQHKRLLIVEDDEEIRRLIMIKLTRAGFTVLTAASGQHALDVIAAQGLPHLAIVDINMPIMGGIEFCERVKQFADLPIIMLTAVDEPQTIIQVIDRFAEDYIIKPFNIDELLARVQRVLRRIGNFDYAQAPIIPINPTLALDLGRQTAIVKGNHVLLTPTETKLLHILLLNAGRALSCEYLLGRVWPTEEVYEETLRVHISRLRQKIEEPATGQNVILTERGHGYRLVTNLPKERARPGKRLPKPMPQDQ